MSLDATVRAYYRAIDAGEYGALASLLAPDFVHERPDRTLSGRERFVAFMREERPRTDTTHAVDAVYEPAAETTGEADAELAVRGRLLGDDAALFGFVDVFRFASTDPDAPVARLTTYTD